jgi:hypothetical protein
MAKATRRERRPQFARVIFYNADMGMISPVVTDDWKRPVAELIRDCEVMWSTNFPGAMCARFIGWYCAQPRGGGCLTVDNLPVPVWQPSADGAAPPAGWLDRLLAEVSGWDPPAVLVQLDAFKITQAGRVLWQSEWGELAERMAREGCEGPAAAEFAARLHRRATTAKATTRKAKPAEPGAAPGRGRKAGPGR